MKLYKSISYHKCGKLRHVYFVDKNHVDSHGYEEFNYQGDIDKSYIVNDKKVSLYIFYNKKYYNI